MQRIETRTARATVGLVMALAMLAAAPAQAQAKRARKPLRCKALKGTAVYSTKQVKVVRRKIDEVDNETFGCARPNGRVYSLGMGQVSDTSNTTIGIDKSAGTWVEVSMSSGSQYGSGSSSTLENLRTGAHYTPFSAGVGISDNSPLASLEALLFDASGRSAAAVAQPTVIGPNMLSVAESITVYGPDGTGVKVDSGPQSEIPASSLTFRHDTVAWTHSGVARSVTFAHG